MDKLPAYLNFFFEKANWDINAQDGHALRWAVSNNDKALVEYLLYNGADPKIAGDGPICIAASNGYVTILKILLSKGADPRARNDWCTRKAIEKNNLKLFKALIPLIPIEGPTLFDLLGMTMVYRINTEHDARGYMREWIENRIKSGDPKALDSVSSIEAAKKLNKEQKQKHS